MLIFHVAVFHSLTLENLVSLVMTYEVVAHCSLEYSMVDKNLVCVCVICMFEKEVFIFWFLFCNKWPFP